MATDDATKSCTLSREMHPLIFTTVAFANSAAVALDLY
jgi:hypothetical protein